MFRTNRSRPFFAVLVVFCLLSTLVFHQSWLLEYDQTTLLSRNTTTSTNMGILSRVVCWLHDKPNKRQCSRLSTLDESSDGAFQFYQKSFQGRFLFNGSIVDYNYGVTTTMVDHNHGATIAMVDHNHNATTAIVDGATMPTGATDIEVDLRWICRQRCCSRRVPAPIRPQTHASTTWDRLSPMDNKMQLAELLVSDNLPVPAEAVYLQYQQEYLECLQPGTVLFIETPKIPDFFRHILPSIQVPVLLVTGDSDGVGDLMYWQEAPDEDKRKIVAWYAMNCHDSSSSISSSSSSSSLSSSSSSSSSSPGNDPLNEPPSDRFHCLPLGLSQWWNQRGELHSFAMRTTRHWKDGIPWIPAKEKTYTLLSSFNVESNVEKRKTIYDLTCTREGQLAGISACLKESDIQRHYDNVRRSKFVVSPMGNGPDCYRTWEALYLGAYVIVETSFQDSLYVGLPVLIVQKWTDITKELLDQTFDVFQRTRFDYRRLFIWYWQREIFMQREAVHWRNQYIVKNGNVVE